MGGYFLRTIMNTSTGGLYGVAKSGGDPNVIATGGILKKEHASPEYVPPAPLPTTVLKAEEEADPKKTLAQIDQGELKRKNKKSTVLTGAGNTLLKG